MMTPQPSFFATTHRADLSSGNIAFAEFGTIHIGREHKLVTRIRYVVAPSDCDTAEAQRFVEVKASEAYGTRATLDPVEVSHPNVRAELINQFEGRISNQ